MNQNNFEYKNETKYEDNNKNMMMGDYGYTDGMNCCMNNMCPPIQECPQERVCHIYICY